MLQVFHLDVVKVDLDVVHVTLGPICSGHLLQQLGPPAWVWRGHHGAGAGHEARAMVRARATVRAQDMEQRGPPREAGAGVRTLDVP